MERNQLLLADLDRRVEASNRRYVGRTVTVLAEGPSKRNPSRWSGRSDTNKVVLFPPTADLEPGDLVTVKVERTTSHSLFGEIVPTAE